MLRAIRHRGGGLPPAATNFRHARIVKRIACPGEIRLRKIHGAILSDPYPGACARRGNAAADPVALSRRKPSASDRNLCKLAVPHDGPRREPAFAGRPYGVRRTSPTVRATVTVGVPVPGPLDGIDRFPRVRLGHTPTPLDPAPRLGAALGVELWVKRDDCTGLAFGGNKVRQLEFHLGEAQARGADTVLITGAVQSNFSRLRGGRRTQAGDGHPRATGRSRRAG